MTVTDNTELSSGLYVPFRGTNKVSDPIGSIQLTLSATGDGSAGQVNAHVLANRIEFGFHPILILTLVEAKDNLAATSERFLQYSSVGNERLGSAITIPKVPIAHGSDFIANWSGSELAIPVEPDGLAGRNIFTVQWATNTNTEVYTCFIFGLLFDAERIAKGVAVHLPDIFYGVR